MAIKMANVIDILVTRRYYLRVNDDERREIILAVSRGELSPEEAAARLETAEALPPPSRPALPGSVTSPPPPPTATGGGITTVRVISDFGSVRVYGDASVAGAVADGMHLAEEDGSTLIIRTSVTGLGGFVFGRRGRIRVGVGTAGNTDRVDVRMNPRLALELEAKAGEVRVEGVEGPIKGDVMAGDVRIERFRSPIQLNVKAGQVRARGRLDSGESHIRCSAGQVRLELESGSSVRVRASARLGNIDLDDGSETVMIGGGAQERVIGAGAGLLDIEASLGQVEVRSEA